MFKCLLQINESQRRSERHQAKQADAGAIAQRGGAAAQNRASQPRQRGNEQALPEKMGKGQGERDTERGIEPDGESHGLFSLTSGFSSGLSFWLIRVRRRVSSAGSRSEVSSR